MKIVKWVSLLLIGLFLAGCGSFEQIPPAHKGKILTPNGYEPSIIPPSRKWIGWREKLVLIDTSTKMIKEPMTMIMSDKLTLKFDVRVRLRVDGSDSVINSMFDDIAMPNDKDKVMRLSLMRVYNTYGRMLVRSIARQVVAKYTVEDVHKNYQRISKELRIALKNAFKSTPLKLADAVMGGIQYPDVITKAVNEAKQRQLQIEREKAQVRIELTKKRGAEQLAQADYRLRMLKARTVRDENRLVASSVTPQYLAYRKLEVQELFARAMKANGNSVIAIPHDAMNGIGAQMRMWKGSGTSNVLSNVGRK